MEISASHVIFWSGGKAINKETRRLRIGVLGCGPIAQAAHFDACRRARNADLYAICDVAEDLVVRMAAVHQPQVAYLSYDEMLADPQVEAVIIAIADRFHVEAAHKAIAAGKHVLVEKPLGITIEECEALRRQVQASGLILQVGTMKRFDPGIAFAQRFVREEMGQVLALKAWYCDSTYRYQMTDTLQPIIVTSEQARRPPGDPKADKRRYYLLTHGSHLVDTVRFLLQSPQNGVKKGDSSPRSLSVSRQETGYQHDSKPSIGAVRRGEIVAVQARRVEKFGAYCWFVAVEFADGSVGHLDLTIAVRMDWHEGFQIYGEYGSVIGKTYNPWYLRSSDVECFSVRDGQYHRVLGADAHFYKLQVEGFADAILHGAPMLGANIDDGVAAMRALIAISRSCENGEWVRLADVTGGV